MSHHDKGASNCPDYNCDCAHVWCRATVARVDSLIPISLAQRSCLNAVLSLLNRNRLIQSLLRFIELLDRRHSPSTPPYYVDLFSECQDGLVIVTRRD